MSTFLALTLAAQFAASVAGNSGETAVAHYATSLDRFIGESCREITAVGETVENELPLQERFARDANEQEGSCRLDLIGAGGVNFRRTAGDGVRCIFPAATGAVYSHFRSDGDGTDWPPGCGGVLFLVMLGYLVVLSRSNLPAEMLCAVRQ